MYYLSMHYLNVSKLIQTRNEPDIRKHRSFQKMAQKFQDGGNYEKGGNQQNDD